MTWSSSSPRGVRRDHDGSHPTPVRWAPDELALDTSGLLAALQRTPVEARPAPPEAISAIGAVPSPDEVERALEDAFARGYEEGRQAGEIAEAARLRHAVQAANDVMVALQEESERRLGNIEANLSALAVAVARHVIGREIAADPSSVGDVVRNALAEFPVDQPLTVRVSASDLAAIQAALAVVGDGPGRVARADVQWIADPRIAPGGCLVEGRDRIIDGRVDTALERLYRRLTYTGA